MSEARDLPPNRDDWWRRAVIYQVYIRSFRDSSGDGIGDIAGIRDGLPYLVDLGVDAIWINPWYPSPMVDAGYDVADYRDIDPLFGTLDDAESLVDAAHRAGLRVIVDLVPNHSSDQHAWFKAALASPPGSPERRRYMFRDGRGPDGREPPNDWQSAFGGRAWTRVTGGGGEPGQWYLHLFAPQQPDFDWTCPDVQSEFLDILEFWLTLGVDGFRIDVAHGLVKAEGLPDIGYASLGVLRNGIAEPHDVEDHPHWDREGVHEIYRQWRRLERRFPHVCLVGEVVMNDIARAARYVRPDELHSAFNFPFLRSEWDAAAMRTVIDATIREATAVGAITTWVLGNHDVTRVATRYADGSPDVGRARAMAATLLMLGLPGGAYIYQGDELGLPEAVDLDPAVRQDPIFIRSGGAEVGRDGCRIPMPWASNEPTFGFSPVGAAAPWLPQPGSWAELSVDRQSADPTSPLRLIRAALRLRRSHPGFADTAFTWVEDATRNVLHFARGHGTRVIVNLGQDPIGIPADAQVLLASAPITRHIVPPGAVCWYEVITALPTSAQRLSEAVC
jgi:alpha-glucosidase